jgi:hypothetical protein
LAGVYTDYSTCERADGPEGYVWGVGYSLAYPGATYVENSAVAQEWAVRLGKPMREVLIETNGHNLRLIFHELNVRELKESDKEWVKSGNYLAIRYSLPSPIPALPSSRRATSKSFARPTFPISLWEV